MTAQDAVKLAKSQVGVKENPPGSNNVKYNTVYYGHVVQDGYPKKSDKYPWCVTFIWWLLSALIMKTASSSTLLAWFQKIGRFFYEPKVGDVVFFKFNKKLTCAAQHVGIVIEVLSPTKIKTIEGNTSMTSNDNGGAVMVRTRSKSEGIVGYGRPKYSDQPSPTPKEHRPTIKEGDKGQDVKDLQNALRDLHYGCQASGIFDKVTTQCTEHYQITHALEPDGIVGPKTWQSLGMYYY